MGQCQWPIDPWWWNNCAVDCNCYVAAKATYIRLLFGKMGVFGPSSVKRGRTHIVLGWNMSSASTSTYPENLGSGGQLPAELRGRVCLVLFVRHATLLGTESPDGAYTYWTWGERAWGPRTVLVIVPILVFVLVFVFVLILVPVRVLQQAATYSIAAVAGNWTILVLVFICSFHWSFKLTVTKKHTRTELPSPPPGSKMPPQSTQAQSTRKYRTTQ